MSLLRLLQRPGWRGALLGLLCALAAWFITRATLFLLLEESFQDGCFSWRGLRHSPSQKKIVIIGLDDKTSAELRKPLLYLSPELAEVVAFLKKKDVAALGLDYLIPDSLWKLPALARGGPGDAVVLGEAGERAGNVVFPEVAITDDGGYVQGWLQPIRHWLSEDKSVLGFINLTEDDDFFVRSQTCTLGPGHAQFALTLAARKLGYAGAAQFLKVEQPRLEAGERLRINFVGPPKTFQELSFLEVLQAARGERPAPTVDFSHAIVILGPTARGDPDRHPTPYSNSFWRSGADLMSGSEIHANVAATLLDRSFIVTVSPLVNFGLVLAAGVVLGRLFSRLNLGGGLLLAIGHHFGWKLICLSAFSYFHLRLAFLPMLVLGILLYGVTFLLRWRTLRHMLGVINSEALARQLDYDPGSMDRRGEQRVITVLFADIRGFTTYSERHAARDVVAMLNAYYSAVVPVIERHGGTVNNYIGDGVMVLFGTLAQHEDHALRAVRAAVDMVGAVTELRSVWARLDFPNFGIGVGIHTGEAVLGMIGSPNRLDYTAIGDTPNTAAHIQDHTRKMPTDILISRETFVEIPPEERARLKCESQGHELEAKGKDKRVEVHMVGVKPPA